MPRDQKVLPQTRMICCLPKHLSWKESLTQLRKWGIHPVRKLPKLGMVITHQQSAVHLDTMSNQLYTEPDTQIRITEPLPNLPFADRRKSPIPWGVEKIGAHYAWNMSRGKGVRVAIIDTGISSQHPVIWANYRGGVNILSPADEPEDYNGHGTHVAGIVAGWGKRMNLWGVAPRASIYAVKAFDRRGVANLSDLLAAINWCMEKQIDVINMSFGMGNVSELLRYAIQKAHNQGIVMVAASGNRGQRQMIDFPARYDETIAVGSVAENGTISSFTNLGRGIDLFAPGEKIPSAWLNQSIRTMSGTSMAVPHVTGTIALLLQINPKLNPEQLRYLLLRSAVQPRMGSRIGIVHAYRAVKMVQKEVI